MSASNSRVRDSIRRIALSDPDIRAIIEDFKNRGGIASDSVNIEGAADGRSICCDGSESGSGTPGSSTKNPDDGGQDASDGLDPDNPAHLDMGPGRLAGVKDCETGEPVCFDGSDWIPPASWESPTNPPLDPSYEEGLYWNANWVFLGQIQGTNAFALSEESACSKAEALWKESSQYQPGAGSCNSGTQSCDPVLEDGSIQSCSPDQEWFDEITADAWPSDGCINLANKSGKFVASKYDPEAQGTTYLKGVDSIELCDDYGNSFSLAPSASGGWKTIDPSSPGDGYLYDANGKQIARISGSEFSDPAV